MITTIAPAIPTITIIIIPSAGDVGVVGSEIDVSLVVIEVVVVVDVVILVVVIGGSNTETVNVMLKLFP